MKMLSRKREHFTVIAAGLQMVMTDFLLFSDLFYKNPVKVNS